MSYSQKSPKPKFIPPIRTAASYLGGPSYRKSVIPGDISPPFQYLLSPTQSKKPGLKPSNKGSLSMPDRDFLLTTSKLTRDISHLQDVLKYSKSIAETPVSSIHILPTNIDQLRTYLDASCRNESRSVNKRAHVCFKERCLEHMIESTGNFNAVKSFDDNSRNFFDLGSPTGNYDITNLKEWYRYMKTRFIERFTLDEKVNLNELGDQLEIYDLIIKAGLKECTRQISVQCFDRGELLSDMLHHQNVYWRSRCAYLESCNRQQKEESKILVEEMSKRLHECKENFRDREMKVRHR